MKRGSARDDAINIGIDPSASVNDCTPREIHNRHTENSEECWTAPSTVKLSHGAATILRARLCAGLAPAHEDCDPESWRSTRDRTNRCTTRAHCHKGCKCQTCSEHTAPRLRDRSASEWHSQARIAADRHRRPRETPSAPCRRALPAPTPPRWEAGRTGQFAMRAICSNCPLRTTKRQSPAAADGKNSGRCKAAELVIPSRAESVHILRWYSVWSREEKHPPIRDEPGARNPGR